MNCPQDCFNQYNHTSCINHHGFQLSQQANHQHIPKSAYNIAHDHDNQSSYMKKLQISLQNRPYTANYIQDSQKLKELSSGFLREPLGLIEDKIPIFGQNIMSQFQPSIELLEGIDMKTKCSMPFNTNNKHQSMSHLLQIKASLQKQNMKVTSVLVELLQRHATNNTTKNRINTQNIDKKDAKKSSNSSGNMISSSLNDQNKFLADDLLTQKTKAAAAANNHIIKGLIQVKTENHNILDEKSPHHSDSTEVASNLGSNSVASAGNLGQDIRSHLTYQRSSSDIKETDLMIPEQTHPDNSTTECSSTPKSSSKSTSPSHAKSTPSVSKKLIGKYTKEERMAKILAYKKKIRKWRDTHPMNRIFNGRSKVAVIKPRIKGKFVSEEEYIAYIKKKGKDNIKDDVCEGYQV